MAGRLWLMHQLTDSPLMLGLVTFAGLGPILLLSMWGGVVADRVNRMRLVVITRALFAFTALLTGVLAATDIIEPWHLLAISLANGVLLSFDIPCRQAIVPNLVPRQHLMNAVVLQSLLMSGSTVIGPFLFAPLVRTLGIEGVFFLRWWNVRRHGCDVRAGRSTATHRRPQADDALARPYGRVRLHSRKHHHHQPRSSRDSGGNLRFFVWDAVAGLRRHRSWRRRRDIWGTCCSQAAIGGLSGTILLILFGRLKDSALLQVASGLMFGLGLLLFAQITYLPASLSFILVVGAASTAFGTINNTLLQSIVDDEFRGRVMSHPSAGLGIVLQSAVFSWAPSRRRSALHLH